MNEIDKQRAEVIAVEQAWVEAHRKLDLDTLEHILSSQYRQIRAAGCCVQWSPLENVR